MPASIPCAILGVILASSVVVTGEEPAADAPQSSDVEAPAAAVPQASDFERPTPTELPAPRLSPAVWIRERHRLRVHFGLSVGFAGALVISGAITQNAAYVDDYVLPRMEATGIALLILSAIPAGTGIYWGVRLGRLRKERPIASLRPTAAGFVLRF